MSDGIISRRAGWFRLLSFCNRDHQQSPSLGKQEPGRQENKMPGIGSADRRPGSWSAPANSGIKFRIAQHITTANYFLRVSAMKRDPPAESGWGRGKILGGSGRRRWARASGFSQSLWSKITVLSLRNLRTLSDEMGAAY